MSSDRAGAAVTLVCAVLLVTAATVGSRVLVGLVVTSLTRPLLFGLYLS